MHTTIYSISESPLDAKQVWVGTDDGVVQLTRDGGTHWSNLTGRIKGLPTASWVSSISASPSSAGTAYASFDRHTDGDMNPWAYRTTDFGQSWTRIAAPEAGIRGYAHVIKEDPAAPNVLYLGTEFGLWISIDSGAHWAQFKGSNFPAVAVRDLTVQPRNGDLVLATHGRGIWIIDDLAALRALTPQALATEFTFLPARPAQQRIVGYGGWAEGDATFSGQNPPSGAVINYYQKTRHVFGRLKLEIFGPDGKLVDTLPAAKHKGINRVVWSMQTAPPRVPTAAQPAGNAQQGPRVLPGNYTVRLTKAGKVYETSLPVVLDNRATYNVDDRKEQLVVTMRAHAMFGRMTDLTERLLGLKQLAEQRQKLPGVSPAVAALAGKFSDSADSLRREIVATKEGGAITGEERLREHLDDIYGALLSYEGRPGDYQVARVDVLGRELQEVDDRVEALVKNDLPKLNAALLGAELEPISDAQARSAGARLAASEQYRQWQEGEQRAVVAAERD